MQGASSSHFTSINILGEAPLNIEVYEKNTGKLLDKKLLKISRRYLKNKELLKAEIRTELNKNYILKIRNSKQLDIREFSSFNHEAGDLKVAIASCLNDKFDKEQKKAAKAIYKLQPDYIFLIGDNVYADSESINSESSPEELEKRYIETRERLALYRNYQLIPTLMIWDDHDYGKNNGDKNYKYKKQSLENFKNFSLNENPEISEKGYGAGFHLKLREKDFFFLDNRFFRDDKYHFGKAQETWLFQKLGKNPILISGDQFFGSYHPFESFSREHPINFKNFISKLEALNISPLFISGDRHLSELQLIRLAKSKFIEITSSPLHSHLATSLKYKNPNRIKSIEGTYNFCITDFNSNLKTSQKQSKNGNSELNYSIKFYNLDTEVVFSYTPLMHETFPIL